MVEPGIELGTSWSGWSGFKRLNWVLDVSDHPYVPSALLSEKQFQVFITPDLLTLESAGIS